MNINVLQIQWHHLFDVQLAWESLPFVLSGLGYTLLISILSFIFGVSFGLVLTLMRMSNLRILQFLARVYVSFFRGVPGLVVLFFLYFGLPFVGIVMDAVPASILGFTLTSSAYSSEIIRSAISSIPKGQWEAGRSLGLTYFTILRKIILPQAARVAVPPLSNVILDLVKSTSLTAMITVPEIFQKAKIIGGSQNNYMTMYFLVAIIYWIICSVYGKLQDKLEARLNVDQKTEKQLETQQTLI